MKEALPTWKELAFVFNGTVCGIILARVLLPESHTWRLVTIGAIMWTICMLLQCNGRKK